MGQITIRMRSQQLGGLPNVRQVDTRGLGASNAEGLAAIGKGVQNLTSGLLQAGNTIDALIERDHERQANEAALAFRKEMDARLNGGDLNDKKYVGLFNTMQVGTGEERGAAAKGFSDNFKKALEESEGAVEASTMNKDVLRRFREKVANYTQSKLNEGNNLANAVWNANTRGAAAAQLVAVTKDAAANPTLDSWVAVENAIDSRAAAEGWTEDQRHVEYEKTAEAIGAGIIDNQLALCQTDEDYARLEAVIANDSDDGAITEEEAEKRAKVLPGDAKKFVDRLTPEQRRKAAEMVASKRYRAATLRNETFSNKVAEVTNKAVSHDINAKGISDEIENLRKAGAPEKMLTPLYRTREVVFDGECAQHAIDLFASIEQRGDVTDYKQAVDAAVKALPEDVQKNADFKKVLEQLTLAGQKAFEANLKVQVGSTREKYRSGDVGMQVSISDRRALLDELREKYPAHYTFEQHQADLAELEQIQKQGDEEMLNDAVKMLQEVAPTESFKSEKGITIVDLTSAFKANDPLATGMGKLFKAYGKEVTEQDVRNTWQEYASAQHAWLAACRENPTWTQKERAQLFYETVVSPTFERLARATLHQTPEQYQQGLGRTISILNRLAEMGSSERQKDVPFHEATRESKTQKPVYNR